MVKDIHEIIRKRRQELGFSTYDMADALFIGQTTYRAIESGKTRMTLENFMTICRFLKLNPYELLLDDKESITVPIRKTDIQELDKAIEFLNKIRAQITT